MEKRLSAINKENHESLMLECMCAHVPGSRTAFLGGRGQAPMGTGQGMSTTSCGPSERIPFTCSSHPQSELGSYTFLLPAPGGSLTDLGHLCPSQDEEGSVKKKKILG